jgi:hypothetical protein
VEDAQVRCKNPKSKSKGKDTGVVGNKTDGGGSPVSEVE